MFLTGTAITDTGEDTDPMFLIATAYNVLESSGIQTLRRALLTVGLYTVYGLTSQPQVLTF